MENTSQEKSDLNRRKAKLMEIRLSAYEAEGRPSYFEKLDGHLRRAIEREAKFQLESFMKSDFYAKELSEREPGIVNRLYRAHCEYYSKLILDQRQTRNGKYNPYSYENTLLERDSKAIYNHTPVHLDTRKEDRTSARARKIDAKIVKQNAQDTIRDHIDAMLNLKDIRTR